MNFKVNGIQQGMLPDGDRLVRAPEFDLVYYTIEAPEGEYKKAHGMSFSTPILSSLEQIKNAFLSAVSKCQ